MQPAWSLTRTCKRSNADQAPSSRSTKVSLFSWRPCLSLVSVCNQSKAESQAQVHAGHAPQQGTSQSRMQRGCVAWPG